VIAMPLHEERDGPIVTLSYEGRTPMNPLAHDEYVALAKRLQELDEEQDVHVAILRGYGEKHFSVGGDLVVIAELHEAMKRESPVGAFVEQYFFPHPGRYSVPGSLVDWFRWHDLIYDRPTQTPVVAATRGACLGAAFVTYMLHSSIRIAGESTLFGFAELRRGMAGGVGLAHPFGQMLDAGVMHLASGELIGAAEARRLGFVNEVVADDRVYERAREVAEKIASMPRWVVLAEKLAIRRFARQPVGHAAAAARVIPTILALRDATDADRGLAETGTKEEVPHARRP
jgi:enoyl-CoA hydratase/carnithine racemase